jgi:hypothetical protein
MPEDRNRSQIRPEKSRKWKPGGAGGLGVVLEELPVSPQELTLVRRHLELVEDGVHRADGLAVGAIDARSGVYVIHLFFIRRGDAAHRTDINARSVLNPDTGFGDHESQSILVLSKTASYTSGMARRLI